LLCRVEVAVWPAEVIALVHLEELFRGRLGVELRRRDRVGDPQLRAPIPELIASMLHHPELSVRRQQSNADRVSNSAREVHRTSLRLASLPRVELPDAGARIELGARVSAGDAWRPV